jgi:uncharacterized phage protein gp47/JayE
MYARSLDSIVEELLTAYENYTGKAPSQEVIVRASMFGSALWGLYNQMDAAVKNLFPDTCDVATMEHWAALYGITRMSGESDLQLLNRLLLRLRRPPAGGNRYDYERWAVECRVDADFAFVRPEDNTTVAYADVGSAVCIPREYGPGTVGVVISTAPTVRLLGFESGGYTAAVSGDIGKTVVGLTTEAAGTLLAYDNDARLWWVRCASALFFGQVEIVDIPTGVGGGTMAQKSVTDTPYSALVQAVYDYIYDIQPVEVATLRVIGVSRSVQNIAVAVTGSGLDLASITSDIEAFVNSLAPGATLYRSKLAAIACDAGAANAVVSTPAADVPADAYTVIRPGTITVT